ncbi:uncharacterized protein LOC117181249 [Belonocnema kinseyi]|uniref:uncharacterized protein LOC117181249 n=1 Tax=Belonocnema kinseyi TaxID=2817044 RepID=UPI00143CE8C0|nr:uncharacterized protein LOC117181249 [Belonocnema kinseyi]
MVERWNRSLKAELMCHVDRDWAKSLPTVLLGLRTNVIDVGASPAEFLYGTVLRIPGEFVLSKEFSIDPQLFLEDFREYMRKFKPIPVEHKHKKKPFLFKDLKTCTHVFLHDFARKALEWPYLGPYRIINRSSEKVYEIEVDVKPRQVSIDNLKPAHFVRGDTGPQGENLSSEGPAGTVVPNVKTCSNKKNVT